MCLRKLRATCVHPQQALEQAASIFLTAARAVLSEMLSTSSFRLIGFVNKIEYQAAKLGFSALFSVYYCLFQRRDVTEQFGMM